MCDPGENSTLMPQFPLVRRVTTVAASSSFYKESQRTQNKQGTEGLA